MKETKIKVRDGVVIIRQSDDFKNKITSFVNEGIYACDTNCETYYPLELIEKIAEVKGAAWVCNEINRDVNRDYIENSIKFDLFSYIPENEFRHKRLLDFGCGSGASSSIVARLLPHTEVIGVEFVKEYIDIALLRNNFYKYENLRFIQSESPESFPENLGNFDFILLNGVFEHLLKNERIYLFPKIWEYLKRSGVMFIANTPNRLFPIELHTTSGLPFLNYLPDSIAYKYSRKFSKRHLENESWENLLRAGIRGTTASEIMGILNKNVTSAELLEPKAKGIKDRIDLWYKSYGIHSYRSLKKYVYYFLKITKYIFRIELVPYLSLAIRKK